MMPNTMAVSYKIYFKYFDDRGSPFLTTTGLATPGIKCHSLLTKNEKQFILTVLQQYLIPYYNGFIMYSNTSG